MPAPLRLIDADQHLYEVYDCCERFIEPAKRDIAVRRAPWKDGIGRVFVGEEKLRFSPTWPIDLMAAPGAFHDQFAGDTPFQEKLIADPIDPKDFPEFYRRDARLAVLDQHDVEAIILQPSLPIGVEHQFHDRPDILYPNITAYNKWLLEDWGWGADGRIFSAAWLSLVDLDLAMAELDRLLKEGVKIIYLKPGPIYGRSPADPYFDPVWSRIEEAGVIITYHTGDSGYAGMFSAPWGEKISPPLHIMSAFQTFLCLGERPIADTLAAIILGGLFQRFPSLRVMSVENGSSWVKALMKGMDKAWNFALARTNFGDTKLMTKPSEVFKQHVWVAPFWEDDIPGLIDVIGVDRVLMGSDFPHPEGTVTPVEFGEQIADDAEAYAKVMRTNCAELLQIAA